MKKPLRIFTGSEEVIPHTSNDRVTVGHVPKFLSKITYFYIKNGGKLLVRITGKRKFSKNLPQGGMELPALYIFKSTNSKMHSKLPGLVAKALNE